MKTLSWTKRPLETEHPLTKKPAGLVTSSHLRPYHVVTLTRVLRADDIRQ